MNQSFGEQSEFSSNTSDNDTISDTQLQNSTKINKKKTLKQKRIDAAKLKKKTVKNKLKTFNFYQNLLTSAGTLTQKAICTDQNSMNIKDSGKNHVWKKNVNPKATDYWVINHFKMKDIEEVESKEQWKVAKCTIRLKTDENSTEDQKFISKINEAIQAGLEIFVDDSETTVNTYTNK